ncbi:MAG: alanine--glyoxylate aminotransferase family protein [Deltaproteobacteria bacterium]|nr:alanine--glyoxylate aminotransferase family protein [Deltaproteobacteria bacterium]MCL5792487.1 alanine--glyoxylate aminotransferase family protein [Deltaproteobacteria bacterium]
MKKYLFTPGPTELPSRVLLAMAHPIIHHRAPEFLPLLEQTRQDLKWLYKTKNEVIIFASSGTGAMESAVSNFLSKGDKALVVNAGKFGERWASLCKVYGVEAIVINVEWGSAVEPEKVKEELKKHPDIKAVYIQATETSTGVVHPVREVAKIIHENSKALVVVDGITGVGVFELPMDDWGIDVLITGSQKALMLPPGLAFVGVSDNAWKLQETSNLPKYYFDLKKEYKNLIKNQTAYTPAISLIVGLGESLKMMREEGLENVYKRHAILARATRSGIQAMGLKLYATSPSNSLTAVSSPDGIDSGKIINMLDKEYGITVANGQDHAKGKIFRITHMGYYDRSDILFVLGTIEIVLNKLGYKTEPGKGAGAAEKVFIEG